MIALALVSLGLTAHCDGPPCTAALTLSVTVTQALALHAEETPLGVVAWAESGDPFAERPTVIVTGLPVLSARGVDVWRGEWSAPLPKILAGDFNASGGHQP